MPMWIFLLNFLILWMRNMGVRFVYVEDAFAGVFMLLDFTCKFIEVVPNVIGLVIVPSIFVVNKFDMSWGGQTDEGLFRREHWHAASKPFLILEH